MWTVDQLERVLAVLKEALDITGDRMDVVDGADSQPRPNWAMSLHSELELAIRLLARYHSSHCGTAERLMLAGIILGALTALEESDHPELSKVAADAEQMGNELTKGD